MDEGYYRNIIKSMRPHRRLGQSFLVKRYIAVAEADYCTGKSVLELGSGLGILTEELCKVASHVTSIEIDRHLYEFLLANVYHENCSLINSDFFSLDFKGVPKADIMVSNVPYNLSGQTLMWLVDRGMPAILCLQKEFVDRMQAKPGSDGYSKLSVFCSLRFSVEQVMKVPADCFYPMPRVDSAVVRLNPKKVKISKDSLRMLSLIMEHKNKKIRNAVEDSSKALGLTKPDARKIADTMKCKDNRVSKMNPEALLDAAAELSSKL